MTSTTATTAGYNYVYGGLNGTVQSYNIDAREATGAPANEISLTSYDGNEIFLDWNGDADTSVLYFGTPGDQATSENPGTGSSRYLSTTVPEPGTLALAGLGGFGLMLFRRRK